MDSRGSNKPSALPGFLIGEQLPAEVPAAAPVDVVPAPAYAAVDPPADGIGRAVPAAKAAGRYPYAADRSAGPGMLYAALARSPYPHAALLHIDAKPALDIPGVHAVLAGQELGVTAVEYRGQCVAVAAAEHPALARAALDAVEIHYAPGEPLLDARQVFAAARRTGNDSRIAAYRRYTLGPGGDLAGPGEGESTVMYGYEFGRGADPAAAPGAVLAVPHFVQDHGHGAEAGNGGTRLAALDLHTACADPMRDLHAVSAAVGLPLEAIHLVPAPFTGTRSGDDADLRVAAALLALRTGRPVRAEGGPADRLAGDAGTPAIRVHCTHRVDAEGSLLGVRVELVVDGGADPIGAEPLLDELCRCVVGPYRCENVEIQGWVVRTHNPPAGPWPGGAAMVAAVVAEAQIDAAAAACGRSPLDLRVKNLIRSGDHLPDGRRLAGAVPLPELLTTLLDTQMPPFPPGPDIRTFPGTVGRTGELTRVRRGAGIALAMVDLVPPELGEEFATAQVALTSDINGPIVHVATSMVDTGNGQHALLRKMAREVLGVRRVIVRRPANPADLPATVIGPGRTTWLHCMAVQRAARAARAQALAKIAAQFAVSPQLLEVRDGMVVTYDGTLSKPVEEVYTQVLRGAAVYVANGEFRVHGTGAPSPGVFVPEPGTAHVAVAAYRAVVDADTELHTLRPVRVTAAHDAGRVLLPERAEAAVGSGVLTAVDFVFNAQAEEIDLAGAELGGFGALGPGQFPTMLEQPELELLPFLESSIGELDSTMLRRRGFAAPLPLGYIPVRRAAYAACAAALACATRDALEAHPTRLPLRPWGVSN